VFGLFVVSSSATLGLASYVGDSAFGLFVASSLATLGLLGVRIVRRFIVSYLGLGS
jgi:hypothetical protein